MKNIEDLRDLLGETEDRVYDGMSMADLFAVFIEHLNDKSASANRALVHQSERIMDLEEKIISLDKLTQELDRMIKIVREESVKKKPALSHWSDLPR